MKLKIVDKWVGGGRVLYEVTKTSMMSGKENTKLLKINPGDLEAWMRQEVLLQNAFPYLSADDREFLKTGILPEEWNGVFAKA